MMQQMSIKASRPVAAPALHGEQLLGLKLCTLGKLERQLTQEARQVSKNERNGVAS